MAPQMWNSGAMKRELGFDDEGRPVLITAAAPAYEEQHRARVRKYLTIMSFRIPALILAAVAYGIWHNGLISLAIVAVSIPLPWIAVLIANDRPRGGPRNPAVTRTRRGTRRFSPGGAARAGGGLERDRATAGGPRGRRRFPLSAVAPDSQPILRSPPHFCTSEGVR